MKDKKINGNNVGGISLKVFVFIILNAGLIFFLIANIIPVKSPTNEASYGDVLTNKTIAKLFKDLKDGYHFYNKPLVYASIGLGAYLSFLFTKFLCNEAKELKRQEKAEEQTERIVNAINKKDEKDVNKYL